MIYFFIFLLYVLTIVISIGYSTNANNTSSYFLVSHLLLLLAFIIYRVYYSADTGSNNNIRIKTISVILRKLIKIMISYVCMENTNMIHNIIILWSKNYIFSIVKNISARQSTKISPKAKPTYLFG